MTELSIQCSTMTLWTTRWNVHNRLPPVLVVEYHFMEYGRHTKDFHRDFDAWCSPSKSKHPIYDYQTVGHRSGIDSMQAHVWMTPGTGDPRVETKVEGHSG